MPDRSANVGTAPRDTWRLAIVRTEASTGAKLGTIYRLPRRERDKLPL